MSLSTTPKIDVHCHHYPQLFLDACRHPESGFEHYYRENDGQLIVLQDGAVALGLAEPSPGLEQRLALMDEAGIEIQVLSLSAPNVYRFPRKTRVDLTRQINDEMLEMASAAPDRFRVFAALPLPDAEDALGELERVRENELCSGVMICSTIDRRTLDDPAFEPLFTTMARYRTPVLVHPTVACCTDGIREYGMALGLDYMAETTNAIARLIYSGRMDMYRGIQWIFGHLGGTTPFVVHRFNTYYPQFGRPDPDGEMAIDKLRRLHFDTVTTNPAALRCGLEVFGPERFVFGTDYPHVPFGLGPTFDTLDEAVDSDDLEMILHGNARGLIGV